MRVALLLIGLCGPVAVALFPPPGELAPDAWSTAGIAFLMAVWWMTGALPMAATALAPLLLAPAFGLGPLGAVAAAYVHPLLFLFLGGFLIGRAIERWGLHRRIALWILGIAGNAPKRLIGGVMLATAFLSLWISNTAAAIVMLPIASSLTLGRPDGDRLSTGLMLGVAYAATIGGMGSLIGTPPNALFAAYVSQTYGRDIGFAQWAAVGLPAAGLLLVAAWLVIVRLTPAAGQAEPADSRLDPPGAWTPAERRVAMVTVLTAAAWILRPLAERLLPWLEVNDAAIAMVAGALLFLLPSGAKGRLLDLAALKSLRWDLLVLFGGGLALAGLIERSGLADRIGAYLALAEGWPVWLLILAMAAAIVYVGELASNTAMAAVFLPVAGAAAASFGLDPVGFLWPIALAASVGFMLPVATPPNAIVMDNPAATRAAMLRAGAILDVVGLLIAVGAGLLLVPLFA